MIFRENIIRKAGELFIANGIKDVSMDMIAKEINISKKTIYGYFRNKDSLVKTASLKAHEEQTQINKRILCESENVIEAVLTFMKNGSDLLDRTNPLYFSDLQRLYPKIWKENIQLGKKYSFILIVELLEKGRKEGAFKEDINEKVIAWILVEQLYMLTNQETLPSFHFSVPDAYRNIIIWMTRGIATREGLEILEGYLKTPEKSG
jgi:TetR/AcrR family transcriptional regulator, cholesterol catabolism regulator